MVAYALNQDIIELMWNLPTHICDIAVAVIKKLLCLVLGQM